MNIKRAAPLDFEEKQYIFKNWKTKTDKEISKHLGVSYQAVLNFRCKNFLVKNEQRKLPKNRRNTYHNLRDILPSEYTERYLTFIELPEFWKFHQEGFTKFQQMKFWNISETVYTDTLEACEIIHGGKPIFKPEKAKPETIKEVAEEPKKPFVRPPAVYSNRQFV